MQSIKFKNCFILLAIVLINACICNVALSQISPSATGIQFTPAERAWLNTHPTVRLGFNPDMQPLLIQNAKGDISGIIPDIFARIEAVTGLGIRIEVGPWSRIIEQVAQGKIDGLALCLPALAKAKGLLPTNGYLSAIPVVFAKRDAPFTINSFEDLKGKRVAHMRSVKFIEKVLSSFKDELTVIEASTIIDAMKMVLEGKADVAFGMNYDTYLLNKSILSGIEPVFIDTTGVVMTTTAVRSELPELKNILNKGLAAIGEADINRIIGKWTTIGTQSQKLSLTDAEHAWLKDHPVIRVASDAAWAPMEYADKKGIYKGIAIDYLRNIEKKLGIRFEIVKNRSWHKLINMAKKRDIDMFSCVAKTPERSKYLSFSAPYTKSPVVIFGRMDVPYIGDLVGLKGKKVAVVKGYAIHETLEKEHPEIRLVTAPNIHESLELLSSGKVYAYVGNLVVTSYNISEHGHNLVKVAGKTPYELSLSMASRNDWPVFKNILNKAVDSISQEERNKINQKWFSVTYEHSFDYSLIWKISVCACLTLVALFFWNRRLKHQVEKKTAALLLNEERLEALLQISNRHNTTEQDLSKYALEEAVRLTRSKGGYFHFYEEETNTILLNIWSEGVLKECQTAESGHYPLEKAGLWADSIRKKMPVIHNDYDRVSDRKGLPEGHFPIYRHLSVPITIDNQIMAIAGVSNKKTPYDNTDIRQLTLLMNDTWQIIQRKRTQKDLRLVKHSVEHSTYPFEWIQKDARFFYVNEASCTSLGYTREELYSMRVSDIDPGFPSARWSGFWEELKEKSIMTFETSHRRKNGEIFPVEITANFLDFEGQEHVFAYVKDISDRVKYETELRRSERKFRAIFERAPVGISIVDSSSGKFIHLNQKYCEIVGYSLEEMLNLNFQKITHPDDLEEDLNNMERLFSGEINEFKMEKRYFSKSGSIVFVLLAVVPLWDEGFQRKFHLAIVEDITEQKKAEKEKTTLESQLQQTHKMEAIGTLAGGIAHDFNNILSSIIGYSEIALEEIPDESPQYSYVQQVVASGQRAGKLVDQILTFSRQQERELKPLKIQLVVKETLKLLRSTIPSTIEIKKYIDPDCGLVYADATQIQQVVMNLCTNAYHAMKPKGGVLSVNLRPINRNPEDNLTGGIFLAPGPYLELKVSDTGCGISKKHVEKVFNPYFTTKKKGDGTGLGLAIVHGIVKDFKGYLDVKSTVGEGTTFIVCLPAINETIPESDEQNESSAMQKGKERILFVDDEKSLVDFNKIMLEGLGYKFSGFTDSRQALEVFNKTPDDFDLIITDMTMPHMTGVELAHNAHKTRPEIPIVLCTGYTDFLDSNRAKKQGIRGYLEKPVLKKEITSIIRNVLDENKATL